MTKINTFYSEKLAEATRKFAALKNELDLATEHHSNEKGFLRSLGRSNQARGKGSGSVPARKLQDLKLAFSEYYLSLVLLQNYQNLNYTGEDPSPSEAR